MLLIAAGVQMAGPKLTPQTFADGLHATKFPNPGAGAAPMYQAAVGFGPNDMTMVKDFTAFWLDTRMSGNEVSSANSMNVDRAYCYVSLGRRFSSVGIPTTDGYYEPKICR